MEDWRSPSFSHSRYLVEVYGLFSLQVFNGGQNKSTTFQTENAGAKRSTNFRMQVDCQLMFSMNISLNS